MTFGAAFGASAGYYLGRFTAAVVILFVLAAIVFVIFFGRYRGSKYPEPVFHALTRIRGTTSQLLWRGRLSASVVAVL